MTVMMFCDTAVLRGELQCGGAEFRPPPVAKICRDPMIRSTIPLYTAGLF